VAGAVAPIKNWIRFERRWTAALKAENVNEFHMTDFAASAKEFAGWKGDKQRRTRFLRELISIVKSNVNKTFAVSVEIDAWNSVNRNYLLEEKLYSPFALGGLTVLHAARKWAKGKAIKTPLEYIFEEGDDGWAGLKTLAAVDGFTPIQLPKSKAIPCQVGDMLAWKVRIAASNSLKMLDEGKLDTGGAIDGLRSILGELHSLEKVLVVPTLNGIYGADALIRTCEGSNIPRRT
jgi:hypothetical protein